jgi:hypothetical protein
MTHPGSNPPTGTARPPTGLQAVAILAALAFVPVVCVLVGVLVHVGGPLLVAWGAPAWVNFAVPAAVSGLLLLMLLGVRALRKYLRRKGEALGIPDPAEGPPVDERGRLSTHGAKLPICCGTSSVARNCRARFRSSGRPASLKPQRLTAHRVPRGVCGEDAPASGQGRPLPAEAG